MRSALAIGFLLLGACAATPTSVLTHIPSDTPAECTRICGGMGLQMSAVVVAASQVGCVCEKGPAAAPSGTTSAAAAVFTANVADQRQKQQQQSRITGTAPPQ